ncbi:hypothetical protein [Amycolatopsis saalfeldensis]|uniref:hypothetical protein n=1 Tax=Amycolatopsis saalfeldensis TaxID=394193 RepID=UPI001C4316DE|nr:hypothetical protein [Amycolatopsis saalfeldensis]
MPHDGPGRLAESLRARRSVIVPASSPGAPARFPVSGAKRSRCWPAPFPSATTPTGTWPTSLSLRSADFRREWAR